MEAVLFPSAGQAVGSYDMRGLFVPWLEFAREAVWNGRLPLWDASLICRLPLPEQSTSRPVLPADLVGDSAAR